ncbi:glutamate formimidoyltransferase [bacterium]|nr:glutamate formimidoyltransferase [bacterium]MBU1024455.1 glutamate formimidoyltransferase [bacterium]
MKKLIECVPNISEGRRIDVIEDVVSQIETVPGATLLEYEHDADHNRAVITFVAEPDAAVEAAFRVIKRASELIDLTKHEGAHPRMGACDVCPFIPLEGATTEDCIELANMLGARVGEELEIPVFLYEDAATRESRRDLANVREGQFEGLREKIGKSKDHVPDYGPEKIHPTAGCIAIGARFFLVAFNVNLDTDETKVAKVIAKTIRSRSGGFPGVKSMGFDLTDRKLSQVSMNMTDYRVTGLWTAFRKIARMTHLMGYEIKESEIVGLIPQKAINEAFVEAFRIANFDEDEQIIDKKLDRMKGDPLKSPLPFLDVLASDAPAPGGGSCAALSGAMAAGLGAMVCRLSFGKKKLKSYESELIAMTEKFDQLREEQFLAIKSDSNAFELIMAANALPKETDEEKKIRRIESRKATLVATEIPLSVMGKSLETIKMLEDLITKGTKNALSDTGSAISHAMSSIMCAYLNVLINVGGIGDNDKQSEMENKADSIKSEGEKIHKRAIAAIIAKLEDD